MQGPESPAGQTEFSVEREKLPGSVTTVSITFTEATTDLYSQLTRSKLTKDCLCFKTKLSKLEIAN